MDEFIACFSEVSDPGQETVRYNLHEVLMIALCTMLCGGWYRAPVGVDDRQIGIDNRFINGRREPSVA